MANQNILPETINSVIAQCSIDNGEAFKVLANDRTIQTMLGSVVMSVVTSGTLSFNWGLTHDIFRSPESNERILQKAGATFNTAVLVNTIVTQYATPIRERAVVLKLMMETPRRETLSQDLEAFIQSLQEHMGQLARGAGN